MKPVLSILAVASLLASPALASAQTCTVPTSSNEAKLQYYYAVPIAYSMPAYVTRMHMGGLTIAGDLTFIPDVDPALQQTSLCHATKGESTSLSSVLPRPRVAIGLPLGLVADVTYLPPVTVSGAAPNMFSAGLARVFGIVPSVALVLRAHTTIGQVEGAITCAKDKLEPTNPSSACYGSTPSEDVYKPNMVGGEAAIAWDAPTRKFGGHVGAGINRLDPNFQVHFDYQNGAKDRTLVQPAEPVMRAALFASGYVTVLSHLDLSAQAYSVSSDATVFRLGAAYKLR